VTEMKKLFMDALESGKSWDQAAQIVQNDYNQNIRHQIRDKPVWKLKVIRNHFIGHPGTDHPVAPEAKIIDHYCRTALWQMVYVQSNRLVYQGTDDGLEVDVANGTKWLAMVAKLKSMDSTRRGASSSSSSSSSQ